MGGQSSWRASDGPALDNGNLSVPMATCRYRVCNANKCPLYKLNALVPLSPPPPSTQVEELLALRERMNAQLAGGVKGGAKDGAAPVKLSVNDFIIKSAAQALKAVPGGCRALRGPRILLGW